MEILGRMEAGSLLRRTILQCTVVNCAVGYSAVGCVFSTGRINSGSVAVIVSQHAAEALAALEFALDSTDVLIRLDQSISQGLVIALPVVVLKVGVHSPSE